jgi:hypothetical protein
MKLKLLFLAILIAIGVVIGYRAVAAQFDWTSFFASLSDLSPGWIVASVFFSLLTYLVRAVRWKALLAPLKEVATAQLFWGTIVGFSAIYVLGRTAELARPIWLTRREGLPFTAAIATIVVERLLDSLMLIAVFAWALSAIEPPRESATVLSALKNAGWIIAAVASAGMAVLFILWAHREWISRLARRIPFERAISLVDNFSLGLSFLSDFRSLAVVVLLSSALWIVMALQVWFMTFGMNLNFSFGAATFMLVALAIGSIAQIPAIGGGFQIAWVFCTTTFFQIPTEQAAATALIAFAVSYAPTIAVGVLCMLAMGISMRDLKASIRGPKIAQG